MNDQLPPPLATIVEDFSFAEGREKLELLYDTSWSRWSGVKSFVITFQDTQGHFLSKVEGNTFPENRSAKRIEKLGFVAPPK